MANVKCKLCGQSSSDKSFYIEQEVNKRDGSIGKKKLYFCCQEHLSKYKKTVLKEQNDLKKLKDYINDLYVEQGVNPNFQLLMSQLSNFMESQDGVKYSGVLYTLKYMVETLEMNLFNDNFNGSILNLLPYYYDEAKEFCIKCNEVKKFAKDFDFEDNIKVVKCGKRERKVDMIDMSTLLS